LTPPSCALILLNWKQALVTATTSAKEDLPLVAMCQREVGPAALAVRRSNPAKGLAYRSA